MAPVRVFGPAKSRNVARVLVCLEEVGAEYEVVDMDLKAREHKSPEHLARNPFGQTPAFQDGDLILFESRAISKYVLHKYKTNEVDLLREGNLKEAAMVDVWTEVDAHTYNPAISPVVYECLINPLVHGDASRGPLRLVSLREDMVGETDGKAIDQEAQRKLGSTKGMICTVHLAFWDHITDSYGVLLLVSLIIKAISFVSSLELHECATFVLAYTLL